MEFNSFKEARIYVSENVRYKDNAELDTLTNQWIYEGKIIVKDIEETQESDDFDEKSKHIV